MTTKAPKKSKPTGLAIMTPQQLSTEKTKASKAMTYATELVIADKAGYDSALERGKEIKTILESVTSRKEEITKPLNDALKSTRELFKPIESTFSDALTTIRTKMTDWYKAEAAKAAEAEKKLADRVDRGTMKPETAIKKAADIQQPTSHSKTDSASATMRTVIKYRVVDKTKIPHEFLEPNMTAIKAEFRAGKPVPGVEAYEEQELAIS